MRRYFCCWIGLLLLGLLAGCRGQSGPKTVPVSGKITWDNQPLANADVSFTPTDKVEGKPAPSSNARTDAQGNFSLKLDQDGRDGAVPGNHRVRVSKMDRGGEGKPGKGQLIPKDYNENTTLNFTVPADGSKEANFALSSNPSAPPVRGRPGGR